MLLKTLGPVRHLLAVAALWVLAGAAYAADLRIVGTDLLGLDFSKALYAFGGREGIRLALAFDGSRPGLDQLKSARADLALLTLPPGDEPDAAVFESVPLAWHRIVIIVPAAMPLERMTFPQLAAIFGADAPVAYNRWGDLGLNGEWADSPIAPHAPAPGLGLTAEFFRHAVLNDRPFKSHVGRYTAPADLSLRLAGDSRAIALAPALPPGSSGLKILPIAARAEDRPFSPTPENVHSGDYPLSLPLRIVFHRDAAGKLLPLLRWILSDAAALVIERAEMVPAPASIRRQQAVALEKK